MLRIIFITILFVNTIRFLTAQEEIQLGRSVISGAGQTFQTQNNSYSFTVGEAIIGTSGNNIGYLTQGFQQPNDKASIQYKKLATDETCPGIKNGGILLTDFKGCPTNEYYVTWQDGQASRHLAGLKTGWYYFKVESCEEVIQDSVFVGLSNENPCGLTFYTAFSPHQDGVNDTWIVDNITISPNDNNKIVFYNIWGQEVKSFTNYDNNKNVWDGKNKKGADLTEGTYYYVLTLSFTTYSGYIELTR
jgi:gliding motility-associated-like protein